MVTEPVQCLAALRTGGCYLWENSNHQVSVGGRERPADILVDRWTRGSPVAVDPTVTHPIAPGQGLSLEAATKAVVTKAQSKIAKYSDLVSTHRLEFVPFVVSTFGELGTHAQTFIDEAAAFYASAQQVPPGEAAMQLRQRLSVVVAQHVGERLLAAVGTAEAGEGGWEGGGVALVRGRFEGVGPG